MVEKRCVDCKKDISDRRPNAKRCNSCFHKHQLTLMREYRNTHKKEIREYQKKYYGKK